MDASDRDLALRVDMLERTLERDAARVDPSATAPSCRARTGAGPCRQRRSGGRRTDARRPGRPRPEGDRPFHGRRHRGEDDPRGPEQRRASHPPHWRPGRCLDRPRQVRRRLHGGAAVQRHRCHHARPARRRHAGRPGLRREREDRSSARSAWPRAGRAAPSRSERQAVRSCSTAGSDSAGHPVLSVGEKGGVLLGIGSSGVRLRRDEALSTTRIPSRSDMFEGGHPGVRVPRLHGKRVLGELVATNGDAGGSLMVAGRQVPSRRSRSRRRLNDGDAMVVVTGGTKGGDLRGWPKRAGKAMFRVSPDASAKDARVSIGAAASGAMRSTSPTRPAPMSEGSAKPRSGAAYSTWRTARG